MNLIYYNQYEREDSKSCPVLDNASVVFDDKREENLKEKNLNRNL